MNRGLAANPKTHESEPPAAASAAGQPSARAESSLIWTRRHLLGLDGMRRAELEAVFALTTECLEWMRDRRSGRTALAGRFVANLFFEDSTRTRNSFTRAAQLLGADVLQMTGAGSSVSKGETTADTARNIEAMGADLLVVRHSAAGAAARLADRLRCRIINAGDGRHEHPTQGLLDLFTLRRRFGADLTGRRIVIVGDIANSRVARSAIFGLHTLGADVTVIGPPNLAPASLVSLGVEVRHDFDAAVESADAVMMLRVQFERLAGRALGSLADYRAGYALTQERAARLPKHAIIMHPGPINRGLETDDAVADGPSSVVLEQVTSGVAIRMAVLRLLLEVA